MVTSKLFPFLFNTANVSGGVPPYSYQWSGGGNDKTKIIPTTSDYQPSTKSYSVTVTDDCGYQVIYQNSFTCNDICADDCIRISRGGFYYQPYCTDVCGSTSAGLELWCDKLEVSCQCDDDVRRTFTWDSRITGTTGLDVIFEGEEVIGGTGETSYGIFDSDGWIHSWVKNETTGCVSWIHTYIPGECFSLWNWFVSLGNSYGGGGGGLDNDGPPDADEDCISYTSEIDDENCQTVWVCVDPPDNDFPDIIDTDEEYCQRSFGYDDDGVYHVYESCYCNSKAEIYATNEDPSYCVCEATVGIVGIDPNHTNYACEMNPVSIEYDTLKESFIYFSSYYNSQAIKPEVTKYNAIKKQVEISNISFVNYSIIQMVLDKERNVILHLKDSLSNSIILKTDQDKNQLWSYEFIRLDKQVIYEIKISDTNNIILTGYDENHQVFETILDDTGNEILTTIEQVQVTNSHTIEDIIFSKNDTSYIALTDGYGLKFMHLVKETIQWQFSIPSSWSLVKYLKDINGNYVIFYNYNQPFNFEGNNYSLFGQNSIGFVVITPSGNVIENYTINYTSSQVLTDIELGRDNYIALMGYYSNHENVDISYLKNNPELCSFLVGLDLAYNNQNSIRESSSIESKVDIIAYPNPTSGSEIEIRLNKTSERGNIYLYNSQNELLYSKRDIQLSAQDSYTLNLGLNALSGVYILKFEGKNNSYSKKLVFIK